MSNGCGTTAAYYRHRRRGEQPCDACRGAHNKRRRELGHHLYGVKHGRFVQAPLDWAKCGTVAQHRAHLRRGERPCKACRDADNRRKQDARQAQRVAS